jgi:hypothetical protein
MKQGFGREEKASGFPGKGHISTIGLSIHLSPEYILKN